jgi:hypothetical protein
MTNKDKPMRIKSLAIFILVNCLMLSCLFTLSYAAQEQVTITTFYPAPNGIYIELRANQMAIGSAYRGGTVTPTDGQLLVSDAIAIGQITTAPYKFVINMSGNRLSPTNDYFAVDNDTGVGLELHSRTSVGTPHIDFSRSNADYDARLAYVGGSVPTMQLSANGTDVSFYMYHGHPYGTNTSGQIWGAGCFRQTYSAYSGWTGCPTGAVTSITSIALAATSGTFLCCYYQ